MPWPAGRPAQIREAARRLDELGRGVADVGARTHALAEVDGWTGPAAATWTDAVPQHAAALDRGAPPLQVAGRALHALADEMEQARAAIDRLADGVLEAEEVADRAARHAVEVRRAWLGGTGLAPGAPPPTDPPDRVLAADAAAVGAADDAADVLRRAVTRARARRDEVRACDRRTAALLEQATAAARDEDAVAWCGTTAGPRPPGGSQWDAAGPGPVGVAWIDGDGAGWQSSPPAGQGWHAPQPADWAAPVEPADWAGPADQAGWADPVQPADWAGPAGQAEWAGPVESADWAGPADQAEWAGPVEPAGQGWRPPRPADGADPVRWEERDV